MGVGVGSGCVFDRDKMGNHVLFCDGMSVRVGFGSSDQKQ